MAIEGTLDDLRLPDILQAVGQQRKTGILTIQGEETIVAVSFLQGRVVAADSLDETVDERLARLLVREGIVDRGALADASARARDGDGRFTDILVAQGHLSREQLLASLRSQTLDLLEQLIGWRHGEFKFYPGEQVSYEEGFDPISVEDLLISWLDHPAFADEPDGIAGSDVPTAALDPGEEVSFAGIAAVAGWELPAPVAAPARPPLELGAGDAFEPQLDGGLDSIDLADEMDWPGIVEVVEPPPGPSRAPLRPVAELELDRDDEVAEAAVPRRREAALPGWLPPILAASLVAALLASILLAPGPFLLPFPWQEPERAGFETLRASARDRTVDRAAKTFFLLEGRFPESLEELVALDLLEPSDIRTTAGDPLAYESHEDSYRLGDRFEAITGNFLLDPELFAPGAASTRAPLVLLD